jgi:hypothetical protein
MQTQPRSENFETGSGKLHHPLPEICTTQQSPSICFIAKPLQLNHHSQTDLFYDALRMWVNPSTQFHQGLEDFYKFHSNS